MHMLRCIGTGLSATAAGVCAAHTEMLAGDPRPALGNKKGAEAPFLDFR
jgi:hypothetical protein